MTGRIAALDGLRAIAILLVLGAHVGEAFIHDPSSAWMAPFTNGSFGVRLFFVLSGYLITSLLLAEQERHGRISLGAFYARRSLRIIPAFAAYVLVVALLGSAGLIDVSHEQLAGAATYSWNYLRLWYPDGPEEGWWFLGHLWTLSLEEQFYLLWPGLIVLAGWRSARKASFVVPLVLPLVRVLLYLLYPSQRGLLGMMFHTAIDSILIGCAFACLNPAIKARLSGAMPCACAAFFAFLVSPFLSFYFRGSYSITIGFGLDAFCAGIMILAASQLGRWATLLGNPPLQFIGVLSYSLYLWQQLFLTSYDKPWTGGFAWGLSATFGCALVSYYGIEKPCLRWKRHFERAHPHR